MVQGPNREPDRQRPCMPGAHVLAGMTDHKHMTQSILSSQVTALWRKRGSKHGMGGRGVEWNEAGGRTLCEECDEAKD